MLISKNKRKNYCFIMEMEVRDYELDCEQIVNNANYMHYMEHTRHCFCKQARMPFIEMHARGIDAVVRKIDIEYKSSLRSGDSFSSALWLERQGPKFIFHQDIIKRDGTVAASAEVTCVAVKDGKLSRGEELMEVFAPYLGK